MKLVGNNELNELDTFHVKAKIILKTPPSNFLKTYTDKIY